MKLVNQQKTVFEYKFLQLILEKTETKKGSYPIKINILAELADDQQKRILDIFRENLSDVVDFEQFNDWTEPAYKFRIVFPVGVAEKIIFKYKAFYEGIEKGIPNPRYDVGSGIEIYFNSFMAGACDVLELEFGLKIDRLNEADDPRTFITEEIYT
jgi:hypothetical protein